MVSTVQKSYRKNILREMKSSISRVVSLFGIVALGVMMLTGLMCIAPDMRTAAQKYYVQQNVFDLRVLSTLGLSQSDISAIAAVDGVDAVQAVKYQDVEGHWTGDEQTTVARLYQLPADPQADTPENMNRPVLLSGRMPEAAGECVVHVMGHGSPVELGTQLTLPEETEGVSGQVFTVVGTVQDPLHFSSDSESSTVGDGQLDCILFVPEGTLTADYYTVCYIKAENAGLYDNYSDEYQAAVDAVAEKLKAIVQQVTGARHFMQLDAAKAQLEAGEKELAAQKAALPDTMQSGADKLVSSEAQVLEFEEQLQQIEMLVNLKKVADPLLTYAEAALRNAEKALDEAEPEDEDYIELRDALAKAQAAYDNIYNQLQGYQQQLDAGKRQMYKQGLISSPNLSNVQLVTEAKAALRKMKLQLLQGQLQLTTGTASAYTQFDAAQKQLEEGWAEYNAGQTQLEESRTEYESRKAEAEQKLADGLAQLNDAEEQVSQIKKGEWYVLDRTSTMSCVTFAQYADRMDAIARVFPVFFFLVAALVATTTMTRMVDENRLQMGTLKALGYSNFSIAGKYLFILGSIVGMVVGFVVFPIIIWNAYQLVFSLPTFTLHFYPGMAAASVGISAAVIGFATWYACRSSLAEKTAALLLPRAPVAGKRILMERITPLWSRMSFSQKTTARNLFRYKKRFFMTVLGVAGCTALLLIGFGIQDSLLPIVTKQSTELTHNDMSITLSDPKALTMEQGLAEELDSNSAVQNWGAVYTKSTTIYNAAGESASVSIVAAAKDSDLTRYVTFRTRKGHKAISFDSGSAILTEKTAENLGLHIGDTFWVENAEGTRVELTLTGITENYMFTRLYLPRAQLESLLGTEDIPWNTVYGQTTCTDAAGYNALRTDLLDCNYVSSISFTEDTTELFDNLIVSLGYVVVLIIICAAALAAVVLYNLISVNLGERKKELATIKVLGFYDQEVYRYIFREIELLALIGSGVGLALGVPLHKFIVLTVEMDQLMFIRTIAPRSYLLAVALTMVFTVVVCFVMRRHVRRISMVESMKAPE